MRPKRSVWFPRCCYALATVAPWLMLAGTARAETTREQRPFTLAGAVNAILPSVGLEAAYQLHDRLAVGAQVTSLLWAHIDASLRGRFFVWAGPNAGIYLGANVHAWYSPLIIERLSPVGTAELGYEYRGSGGSTFGVGLGAGVIYARGEVAGGGDGAEPLVIANLRFGRSW